MKLKELVAFLARELEDMDDEDPEVEIEWVSCRGFGTCGFPIAHVADVVAFEGKLRIEAGEV